MGNYFTKIAKLPKAALLLLLTTLSSLVVLSALVPGANAISPSSLGPTGMAGSVFIVRLNGSKNPSQYTVSAQRLQGASNSSPTDNDNHPAFTFQPKGVLKGETNPEFATRTPFIWGGDNSACVNSPSNPSNTAKNFSWTFTVTVTATGKVAKTDSVNFCGMANYTNDFVLIPLSVTDGTSTTTGTASGTLSYMAPDGTIQPFRSNTTAKIGSTTVSVKDDGSFTSPPLTPGNYTLLADYTVTDTSHGETSGRLYEIKQSIKIAANTNTPIYLTIQPDGSINTSPSNPITTTTCSSTDNSGNCKNTADDSLDCGAGGWNWVICSGIQLLQSGADKLDSLITSQLNVDTGKIFANGDTTKAYKTAWNSFRIIAIAILVIAGLIMVTSQALGFEFLDAYTIRKVLPRLLIAIIGISISWPILQFVINFFDVVGYDVRELIYAPFNAMAKNGGVSTLILLGNPLTLIAAGSALFIAYGPAVFTFLLTGFLALMVAFLVLVIRQIAIIILVIMAPLAIACYILPNTQKVWKLWTDNFMGLMLMFPIISALIAAGHVMSAVGRQGGAFEQFVSIIAYFAPYFMLPFAFRLATGAISTIAGLVNDRSKGAFDRLKKYRGAKLGENMHAMKEGNRFSERNALTRSFNRTTVGAGTGFKGQFGLGKRGKQAVDQTRRNAAMNSVMKSPNWAPISEQDDTLRAATYDSADLARAGLTARFHAANLKKVGTTDASGNIYTAARAIADAQGQADAAVASVQTSIGFGRPQAIAAAQQLATTGTGYENLADQALTIARASGGNSSTVGAIAGYNNFINKQKGRHDLAPGAGNLIETTNQAMKGATEADRVASANAAAAKQAENTWNSGSLYQLANGKAKATTNLTDHWVNEYSEAIRTDDTNRLVKATTAMREMRAMMPNASGDNQKILNDALNHMNAMREDYQRANGFIGAGIGPQTAAEVAFNQAERIAGNSARLYERPDPNILAGS